MSARGIPKSYRHMHGFGSHTFSFINAANERFWVKFHFRSQQGVENLTDAESTALIGADRESHQRDLLGAIAAGDLDRKSVLQGQGVSGCVDHGGARSIKKKKHENT